MRYGTDVFSGSVEQQNGALPVSLDNLEQGEV
jgi:hypothetical protein